MRCSAAALVLVCITWALLDSADAAPTQAQVMAEFIERFTRFIDWPEPALGPSEPFVVCVLGQAALRAPLETILRSRPIKGRRGVLRVVDGRQLDELADCHVLYIAPGEMKRLRPLLDIAYGRPILTVADTPGAAAAGILINFYRTGNYIRFEINMAAVANGGLKARARLLRHARLITGGP